MRIVVSLLVFTLYAVDAVKLTDVNGHALGVGKMNQSHLIQQGTLSQQNLAKVRSDAAEMWRSQQARDSVVKNMNKHNTNSVYKVQNVTVEAPSDRIGWPNGGDSHARHHFESGSSQPLAKKLQRMIEQERVTTHAREVGIDSEGSLESESPAPESSPEHLRYVVEASGELRTRFSNTPTSNVIRKVSNKLAEEAKPKAAHKLFKHTPQSESYLQSYASTSLAQDYTEMSNNHSSSHFDSRSARFTWDSMSRAAVFFHALNSSFQTYMWAIGSKTLPVGLPAPDVTRKIVFVVVGVGLLACVAVSFASWAVPTHADQQAHQQPGRREQQHRMRPPDTARQERMRPIDTE